MPSSSPHIAPTIIESPPPSLAFWRDFSKHFISRSCALLASCEAISPESVDPPPELLDELVSGAPPMKGAEYLSAEVLASLWRDLGSTLTREAAARKLSVHDFLASLDPAWRLVGRVCFHLAELRDNKVTPFAFLATYVGEPSRGGRARHIRLGDAVEHSGKARDNSSLLTLLAPVERAALASPFIRELVDSGAIFQTSAWTPSEAYEFLKSVPALEASGVTVRIPDWWKPSHPPRVSVRVSVGGDAPSTLGADALLGFSVELALDGEKISAADWKAIRQGTAGLAPVTAVKRGRRASNPAGKMASAELEAVFGIELAGPSTTEPASDETRSVGKPTKRKTPSERPRSARAGGKAKRAGKAGTAKRAAASRSGGPAKKAATTRSVRQNRRGKR